MGSRTSSNDGVVIEGGVTRSQTWLLGTWVFRLIIGLGITVCLGRFLDPASFGFFAFVGTLLLLGQIIMDLGAGAVAVREIAKDPDAERRILEGVLGWRHLVALILASMISALALTEAGHRQTVLLVVAASMIAVSWSATSIVMTLRQEQGSMQTIGAAAQALVLIGCFALEALGVAGALFALLPCARDAVNAAGTTVLAIRRLGYRPIPRLKGVGLSGFLRIAVLHGLAVLVQTTYFHVDVVFVRWFRSEAELGAYAAAFRPINPLLLLPGALMAPVLPLIARLTAEDRARFGDCVRAGGSLLLGLGLIGGAAGFLLAPELLELLYGGRYLQADLSSVGSLRWLSIAFMAVFATAPFATALLADGGEKTLLRIACLGLVINVLGNAILLPRWGFEAAALTTATTELTVFLSIVVAATRIPELRKAHPTPSSILPAVAFVFVMWLVPISGGARIATGIALAAVTASCIVFGPVGRRFRRVHGDV